MSENTDANLPTQFGVLLFTTFEPLDTFGPIEAFQGLSGVRKIDLAIIGPTLEPVDSALPKDSPFYSHGVGSKFGFKIVPTHTYDNPPENLDVLLIPGGFGVLSPDISATVEFLKKTYPKLKYLLTVCNGAAIAAMAGVLDGKKATTNKALWKTTTASGPKVEWVKTARYVVDGNCWTSSGVSAGIDSALAWIAHVYGEKQARDIANQMEYEWRDDRSWDPFAYMWGEGH